MSIVPLHGVSDDDSAVIGSEGRCGPVASRGVMLGLVTGLSVPAGLGLLPVPSGVVFQGDGADDGVPIMALTLASVPDGLAWSVHLGGKTRTYVYRDGRRYLDEGVIRWRDWSVHLHACEPVTVGLDQGPGVAS